MQKHVGAFLERKSINNNARKTKVVNFCQNKIYNNNMWPKVYSRIVEDFQPAVCTNFRAQYNYIVVADSIKNLSSSSSG